MQSLEENARGTLVVACVGKEKEGEEEVAEKHDGLSAEKKTSRGFGTDCLRHRFCEPQDGPG